MAFLVRIGVIFDMIRGCTRKPLLKYVTGTKLRRVLEGCKTVLSRLAILEKCGELEVLSTLD
jgi:hypothetical protein